MADVQAPAGPVRRPGFLAPEQIEALVRERFGEAAGAFEARAEDSTLWIDRGRLVEVLRFLKTDPRLSFDFLMVLTGMDWKDKLGVVYHLFSYSFRHRFGIKASCPYDDPHIASVEKLWKTAEWQEREAFDLFGIVFDGHPDLRRVLMPEDWIGHPMRKDYQEPPDYRGIPTSRPNPLAILEEFNRREQERVNEKRKAEAPADAAPAAGHGHAPKPAEGE